MAFGTGISKDDILDSIVLFAVSHDKPTFSARDCAAWLQMACVPLDEEKTDELMSELVDKKQLRQVGPGIYAKQKGATVPLQQQIWPEEGRG